MKKLLLFLLLLPAVMPAQNTKEDNARLPLKPFISNWKGDGDGESGKGKYERTYQFILGKILFRTATNQLTLQPSVMIRKGK